MCACLQQLAVPHSSPHPHLEKELSAYGSLTFIMMPHLPRLSELSATTPTLILYAALISELSKDNLDNVPKELRSNKEVQHFMHAVADTKIIPMLEKQQQKVEALAAVEAEREIRRREAELEALLRAKGVTDPDILSALRGETPETS